MPLNLSLSDVYNQGATTFYKLSFEIVTCFQLLVLPFLIYIILTQSKKMRTYRWYLLNTILWNTLMEITQCLTCPMILSPFPLIFFSGPLYFLDMSTLYYSFEILLYCAASMCIGAIASVGYRIATLLDVKFALSMFNYPRCVLLFGISLGI
jgi:hypothetical protein